MHLKCIYATFRLPHTTHYTQHAQTDTGAYKYPDPRTGEPINFNFLPTYADAGLGVMPHTVQVCLSCLVLSCLVLSSLVLSSLALPSLSVSCICVLL